MADDDDEIAGLGKPVKLGDYRPQPGDVAVFIEGQAEGAIPNGTRIVKVWSEPGDTNPNGTTGRVLASHRHGDLLGYFVEWDSYPGKPVFLIGTKIGRADETQFFGGKQ